MLQIVASLTYNCRGVIYNCEFCIIQAIFTSLWVKVVLVIQQLGGQILMPGGSMGSGYFLQLLLSTKITNLLTTKQSHKKWVDILNRLNLWKFLLYFWWNLKKELILLNKISHWFLVTTKLLTGCYVPNINIFQCTMFHWGAFITTLNLDESKFRWKLK
jgi:hypothetical protein